MTDNNELKMLEEELYGINNAVSKAEERLNIVTTTESKLAEVQKILLDTKNIAVNSYDTKYNQITENILKIQEIAKDIPYKELNDFNKEEIIPQGAISYNFNNINYNSLIMALPMSPPISKDQLKTFLLEIDSRNSNLLLQLSQLKSYNKKLNLIIDNLSAAALASYLCS